MMDGRIGVDSVPGTGSRFWFTLLLQRDTSPPHEPARFALAPFEEMLRTGHAGARVLLVEDEPISQEITRSLLADTELRVDVAGDGAQAVAMAAANAYDAILMDMEMPVLNGLDATRRIRLLPQHARTPVIAMTANAFPEDRERCFAAGMSDHLPKPVEPEALFATLLSWLATAEGDAGA
jgi:CheY-like chemotaxis protein